MNLKSKNARGQLSLEMLVVLAALLAFFLAFAPAIGASGDLAGYAMKEQQMRFGFEKICWMAVEAENLGKGAVLAAEAYFPEEMRLSFARGKFIGEYEIFGRKRQVGKELKYLMELEEQTIRIGRQILTAENAGDAIKLGIAAEKG
ncbi:MAG: hypothetical protein ABIG96_00145 [Candidatus Micrarchaeota archaeon]